MQHQPCTHQAALQQQADAHVRQPVLHQACHGGGKGWPDPDGQLRSGWCCRRPATNLRQILISAAYSGEAERRLPQVSDNPLDGSSLQDQTDRARDDAGVSSPMEAHSSYRGSDWTPQRLAFHQNLEAFAERVGLIVALQSNAKISQESAYTEIRKIWKDLKESKDSLLH